MASDLELGEKLRAAVELDYRGERRVRHLLEVLRDDVTWAEVRAQVARPLTGLKVAAYYGCLLLRPEREMEFDDPESPSILHDLLRALGAEPVSYPLQADCCGAFVSLRDDRFEAAGRVLKSAAAAGADLVVTSCPSCNYNLDRARTGLPVVYFTQLLAIALGLDGHFGEGMSDPRPLLRARSLLSEVS
ncbi:MAG TPA: heterodisulfide reductase-related iron-sulfur binding cluster [Bacillota bacterium]|nr:heterodisulfide reductase-related iron-sulfur binding cluster [Bacillota bacterium]